MRFLITADWQADWSNLDTCEQAWNQCVDTAEQNRVEAIIVAGDLKRVYNPVDVRVTKWWMKAIDRAEKLGIDIICSLGNHDRIGQHDDGENWFPILRRARATAIDRPTMLYDDQLAILPFCSDKDKLRMNARQLAKYSDPKKTILIFHEDLLNCKYNKLGHRSENGIAANDLYPTRYRYCFGGHIHLRQKVRENVWYVGSPFCQDWGESNQRKGFTLLDGQPSFVPSTIPGWFDPTWPGFYEPESWEGCSVRVHAQCRTGTDFLETTEAVRRSAEKRYPGAELYVTASFDGDRRVGSEAGFGIETPDEAKITEYVKQTCPENLNAKSVIKYLLRKLDKVGGQSRSMKGIRFVEAEGRNFLSFKKLKVRWHGRGITLVQGRNRDRKGKSNGAGKTSILQTIPVALFGATFKGQKHDRWARRNAQGKASVDLVLRDTRGRRIEILRQRKPTKLQLLIDGQDVSTGMNPNDKSATQGEIETLTGLTWQTLANAVYIDQGVASAFISGTKKERTDVLAKFQNLERFQKALVLVRNDNGREVEFQKERQQASLVLQERIDGLRKRISILLEESQQRVESARKNCLYEEKRYLRAQRDLQPKIDQLSVKEDRVIEEGEELLKECNQREFEFREWRTKRDIANDELAELEAASKLDECPKCRQKVDKESLGKMILKAKRSMLEICATYQVAAKKVRDVKLAYQLKEGESDQIQSRLTGIEREFNGYKIACTHAQKTYVDIRKREHLQSQAKIDARKELDQTKAKKKIIDDELSESYRTQEFYQYCERAMSRDGIPAFLNALLCPQLNAASDYYAEMFGDKAVQVIFEIENGEFVPQIFNSTGGEDIDSQSDGEKALAGLIASFALREIAPKCNVLILDEPGHGLDPSTARQFARALKDLKGKFESIFVTSHNVHILEELEGEKSLLVEKRNGVSNVLEAIR